jgi:hypothetical protein
MSLFRSEEHLNDWLRRTGNTRGEVLDIEQTWRLAKAWYADPRASGWAPRTMEESQAVLHSVGLRSPFWQLTGS